MEEKTFALSKHSVPVLEADTEQEILRLFLLEIQSNLKLREPVCKSSSKATPSSQYAVGSSKHHFFLFIFILYKFYEHLQINNIFNLVK